MSERLAGKHALITGGSRGIGKAIADAFASEGCNLTLVGRNKEDLKRTEIEIRSQYEISVRSAICDVINRDCVENMVSEAEATAPIDILVNNAGSHGASSFLDYRFEDFKNILEANLYSVFHVTQTVIPHMVKREKGRVINLASTAGKWGSRNQSAYNASKHAVVGITRCLGLEMAPHKVLVNAICPWVVETDMASAFISKHSSILSLSEEEFETGLRESVPLKRWVQPKEVAGLAVYLASEEASYVSGQAWTIDGGYTML
jgi:meso-butanediol dehydrogenase/(S,S)-butanediol dehydrogenase/diacetyl reductase